MSQKQGLGWDWLEPKAVSQAGSVDRRSVVSNALLESNHCSLYASKVNRKQVGGGISQHSRSDHFTKASVAATAATKATVNALELFVILKNCPRHLSETWRLSKFFENLLQNQNLKTVLAATLHTLEYNASDEMKVFYKHLDAKYNISLGKSLIGFSNTRQLEELAALDLPYLEDYREDINQCLNEGRCDNLPDKAGNTN